jgi:hypothetical protein
MIPWLSLFTATTWVDLIGVVLAKLGLLGTYLPKWYADFGVIAVAADILVIVLAIALAMFLAPGASGLALMTVAFGVQIVHDIVLYGIIRAVPKGQNQIMDLFKLYAAEGSWKILLADAIMVTGSIWGMETLQRTLNPDQIAWLGILGFYSLLYLLFTH